MKNSADGAVRRGPSGSALGSGGCDSCRRDQYAALVLVASTSVFQTEGMGSSPICCSSSAFHGGRLNNAWAGGREPGYKTPGALLGVALTSRTKTCPAPPVVEIGRCRYPPHGVYVAVAQLVERHLAKVEVAGSMPVSYSMWRAGNALKSNQ